jgi:SAM-dependent methyltransferase
MSLRYVNPLTGALLNQKGERLADSTGTSFPIVGGIARFCSTENYTENFGKQWNSFEKTQLDGEGFPREISSNRLFAETGWTRAALSGQAVLEVGSGAGRFSRVILEETEAILYSVDYSSAVEANWRNNRAFGNDRFHLSQASIYELPFAPGSFDKILCLGVLQHTPDFAKAVTALVAMARPGGEIVVDFYPIRGWWTKIHAKYLLRPMTRRMAHDRLMRLLDANLDGLIAVARGLDRVGLHVLSRFLPLVDLRTLPPDMSAEQQREAILLDTFDMMSPEYDQPQRIETVAEMFRQAGARVDFAGWIDNGVALAAVVRGTRN